MKMTKAVVQGRAEFFHPSGSVFQRRSRSRLPTPAPHQTQTKPLTRAARLGVSLVFADEGTAQVSRDLSCGAADKLLLS